MKNSSSKRCFAIAYLVVYLTVLLLVTGYIVLERVAAAVSPLCMGSLKSAQVEKATDAIVLYRGDARRTGAFSETGLRQMSRVRWQLTVGEITHGPPVFANGIIYLLGRDGRLWAIDSGTGNKLWSFKPKPQTPLFSPVAVANGVVYVGQQNRLYALDAQTGQKLWKTKTKDLALTAPLVVGSTVYSSCFDGKLYAIDARTGEKKWTLAIGDSDTPPVYDNGTIYVTSADFDANRSFLIAIDSESGAEKWKVEKQSSTGWSNGIVIADGLLYVGGGDGRFYAVDSQTGAEVWSYQAGLGSWSRPAIFDGTVFVGSDDQNVYALNSQTGELRWKFRSEASATADPIVSGGVVYFGVANLNDTTTRRPFYAVDVQTGEELWRFLADSRILASAAVGNGAVYFASNQQGSIGTLYAIE